MTSRRQEKAFKIAIVLSSLDAADITKFVDDPIRTVRGQQGFVHATETRINRGSQQEKVKTPRKFQALPSYSAAHQQLI